MNHVLTAADLLAGAHQTHRIDVPADLLPDAEASGGSVVLRPLTVRDVQRITAAAKEQKVLTSVLMTQQALVEPELTVEQVSALPAGLVRFLVGAVNRISGLAMGEDDLEATLRAPLARACFTLSREFGWTPEQCAGLTLGQVLLYLEMLGRGETPEGMP
ncbi:hypothetical protein [uncultured Rhodospira sp.]|uniref:hypothetical protein n=1 Tax=uncultured Rhodospira sp. TaxID=1936189 RepID=UPI00260FDAF0|nr:hypothetical protein [uncultured Rhodospira sp.]